MDKQFVQEKLRSRHCEDLARHLSDADYKELVANGDLALEGSVVALLLQAVGAEGCVHYAIRNKHSGVTYCIGGYDETGLCWFLTSKLVAGFNKLERAVFRSALAGNLMETLKVHPVLHNAVWAGNTQHQRLVASMGARWDDPCIINGNTFLPFTFHREDYPISN